MKKILITTLLTLSVLVPAITSAQNGAPASYDTGEKVTNMGSGSAPVNMGSGSGKVTPIVRLDNPIKADNVEKLLLTVTDLAIFIGTMFAVIMFFWVGFKFVMARGNQSEISDAKEMFMYIVIGTAVLIASKVIVASIEKTLISAGVVDERVFKLPGNP